MPLSLYLSPQHRQTLTESFNGERLLSHKLNHLFALSQIISLIVWVWAFNYPPWLRVSQTPIFLSLSLSLAARTDETSGQQTSDDFHHNTNCLQRVIEFGNEGLIEDGCHVNDVAATLYWRVYGFAHWAARSFIQWASDAETRQAVKSESQLKIVTSERSSLVYCEVWLQVVICRPYLMDGIISTLVF